MNRLTYTAIVLLIGYVQLSNKLLAQEFSWKDYYITWDKPSTHSGESMPLGGGDIGLNVWVENGDILFYLGKSGAFDENNTLLKLGRVRLQLYPNPFEGTKFKQQLQVDHGQVVISGEHNGVQAEVLLWVDIERPNVYVDVQANKKIEVEASYESWRYKDLFPKKRENNANSWKWAPPHEVVTKRDSVYANDGKVIFFHQNTDSTVFDIVVRQQGMEAVKDSLYNPLVDLISGGVLQSNGFSFLEQRSGTYMDTDYKAWVLKSKKPATKHDLQVSLHVAGPVSVAQWQQQLDAVSNSGESKKRIKSRNLDWWRNFWDRSYIRIQPTEPEETQKGWQVGRNYQLFRFMLAANAYGEYPTKFNGGLFTYDPSSIDSTMNFTPDFRNWGWRNAYGAESAFGILADVKKWRLRYDALAI